MVRPLEPKLDRDVTGSEIDDAARNEERRNAARPFLGEHERGFGNPLDPADARSDHHACRDLVFVTRRLPAGMLDRLARGAHRVNDELVDPALLLRLHPLIGIVGAVGTVAARNRTRNFRREIPYFELVDSLRPALTGEQALPCRLDAAAERRHHSEPRDDHTPHAACLPLSASVGESRPAALSRISKP